MKKAAFQALCLLVFLNLASGAISAQIVKHTLQKGETLYSISRLYKVPYEALAAANGVTDPTKVKTGIILIIPSVHIVAKGETLYGLARQNGVTLDELLASNKLSATYVLKVGDVLVIPAVPSGETTISTLAPSLSTATVPTTTATVPTTTATVPTTTATVPAITATVPTTTALVSSTSVTVSTAANVSSSTGQPPAKQGGQIVSLPDPVRTQDRTVDASLAWPASGKAMYLDGKLEGVMIRVKPGETAKVIASGTVVSAGPSRGFSQVVFVQAKSGYVYVYGGIETLGVKTGDRLSSGGELGRIGLDAKEGAPIAYFFVFRNGQPIDPATAPRD